MNAVEKSVKDYYDSLGLEASDWQAQGLRGEVSAHVHRRFLERYIRPGDRVLEIGAGIGRYTMQIVQLGARVMVTDISERQLEMNEEVVGQADCEHGVLGREVQTITDLRDYSTGSYDKVVAMGGPLSYAFDTEMQDKSIAALEMLRAARNGVVIGSVMSRLGMLRWYYENRPDYVMDDDYATESFAVMGDMIRKPASSGHVCNMYDTHDLDILFWRAGGEVFDSSASNFLSMTSEERLQVIKASPEAWETFLRREALLCKEAGVRDAGSHILFARHAGIRDFPTSVRL
jgi:SAM-dependent methyltransferase